MHCDSPSPARAAGAAARWVAAWPGGAALGVLNGTAREALYARAA